MAVFIDLRPQLKHIRLLYIFIGILVCTASFKGCHSGKLGEFNGHRTVPVDINNRYKKATSNGMDCYVTGTVPGVGDCTIKVTESAYDEAKKKGKYQRLYFDLYGSEYMSSGWLLPVLLLPVLLLAAACMAGGGLAIFNVCHYIVELVERYHG